MNAAYDVLIVGGGHGGAAAATALRQLDFRGSIAIVGDEPELPYDRPPLSKEYLAGDKSWDRLVFRTAESWREKGVDLLLGAPVVWVDPDRHCVSTEAGDQISYGKLIWATGGRARQIGCDGATLRGVHSVRNRADVDRLIGELPRASDVVVIGGGFIGLEAAAVLVKLGKRVTLVEALDRVLSRVAGPAISRFYEDEHRAHGVAVKAGTAVACIEGAGGGVTGVRIADGSVLPAQIVIVGIGIVPAVEPLTAAGAAGANGVDVDAFCRTSLADVYAIGDCAAHENVFAGGARIRVESVQNANDQAMTAARDIAGDPRPYDATPWFWSNQFDLRLQTVGLANGYDREIVRGDPASRSFSVAYLRGGRVIALDCVNNVRDYTHGRALVTAGAAPDQAAMADAGIPLKSLLS